MKNLLFKLISVLFIISTLNLWGCAGSGNSNGNVYYQSRPGSSPWRGYYYRPVTIDDTGDRQPEPPPNPDYPEAVPLPEPPTEIPDFGAPDMDSSIL